MTKIRFLTSIGLLVFIHLGSAQKPAEIALSIGPLDPTRSIAPGAAAPVRLLPEQYLWTADDITVQRTDRSKYSWSRTDLRIEPHFFRAHFHVKSIARNATLYIAGPRQARAYLNGQLIGEFSSNVDAPIGFRVFHCDAAKALKVGENVLAIEAVRGRGVVSGAGPIETQQLAYGEVLVAKLVPGRFGEDVPAIVFSDSKWRSSATFMDGWMAPAFHDVAWLPAASLGPVESNVDFFQWSADAGMYEWPGYMGMSDHLRTYSLAATAVSHVFAGSASLSHIDALTKQMPGAEFSVSFPKSGLPATDAEAPQILLDFGREVSGRLLVESGSAQDSLLSIAYGESEIEALATGLTTGQRGGNYLGTNLLEVPANGTARGPKSGFRYVRIRFLRGAQVSVFKSLRVEGIYEPVKYLGSFESSDPLLNHIWETGAYTAHLCMQDGVWDAVKRDRGRWVGDMDIEGRVISTVFGDSDVVKDTLRRLAEATPEKQYMNGIASYSALWITTLDNLYEHDGDLAFLKTQQPALLRILSRMDQDIDANGDINATAKGWGFVDWAPGLYGFNPETRMGTQLQYVRGYVAASRLLVELGNREDADKYAQQAERLKIRAQSYMDSATGTLGSTWQLNALAILDEVKPADGSVWDRVLSKVKQDTPTDQVISPYFNAYVMDAMSQLGHQDEALKWMRDYWGGMLAEGATSFWESYDLRWPKTDPHLSLQADGTSGYFVSMAHGWSSGPTAWLTENVLGVTPSAPGYETVDIHPNLLGLDFARGTVPTPHGLIHVDIEKAKGVALDIPSGVARANVTVVRPNSASRVYLDGRLIPCDDTDCRNGTIDPHGQVIEVTDAGHHDIEVK